MLKINSNKAQKIKDDILIIIKMITKIKKWFLCIPPGMLWIGVGQFFQLVAAFLLLKVLTANLSINDFGYYTVFVTGVLFVRQIIYDPVSTLAGKKCALASSIDGQLTEQKLIARYLMDNMAICGFALLGLSFIYFLMGGDIKLPVLIAFFAYLVGNGAQGVFVNILNCVRARRLAAQLLMLDPIAKLVFIGGLIMFGFINLNTVILVIGFSALLSGFLSRQYMFRGVLDTQYVDNISRKSMDLMVASLPFLLPSIFTAVKSVSERWILGFFVGLEELAIFNVMLQIGFMPILLLAGVVQTFISPRIYELASFRSEERNTALLAFLKTVILYFLGFSLFFVGSAWVAAGLVIDLIAGGEYTAYASYLLFFVAAAGLAAIAGVLQVSVIATLSSRAAGALMSYSIGLSVLSSVFLIECLGFDGAVIGMLLGPIISIMFYGFRIKCIRNTCLGLHEN